MFLSYEASGTFKTSQTGRSLMDLMTYLCGKKPAWIDTRKWLGDSPDRCLHNTFLGNQICFVSGYCFRPVGKLPYASKGCKSFQRPRCTFEGFQSNGEFLEWIENNSQQFYYVIFLFRFAFVINHWNMPERAVVLPLFTKVNVKMKQRQIPLSTKGKIPSRSWPFKWSWIMKPIISISVSI